MKTLNGNRYRLILIFIICLRINSVHATNYTWVGDTSTVWATSANWSPSSGVPSINDTVTITSAGTYQPVLDQNRTVKKFTMTSGTLNLNTYNLTISNTSVFTAGTISNGKIYPTGVQATYSGTTFNCEVNSVAGKVFLNGSTFNYRSYFEDTISTATHYGNGGNTFNAPAVFKKNSVFHWGISNTTGNTFNDSAIFLNIRGNNLVATDQGTTNFNGHIAIGSNAGGDIAFTGSATLASGKTIGIDATTGFTSGDLRLNNFIQSGSTSQSFTMTGSATLSFYNDTWNGAVSFIAPHVLLKMSTFNSTASFQQTHATIGSNSDGGNTFNGAVTLNSSGALLRMGTTYDDTFNSNLTVVGAVNIGTATTTIIKGNLTAAGSSYQFNNGAVAGTLKFAGSNAQHISSAGVIGFNKIKIDKTVGSVTLDSTITVDDTLTFVSGNIISTSTHLLSMLAGSTVTGASNSSFVSGPVKKTGNTAFIFPTGKNSDYRAVSISAPSSASDAFTGEYLNTGQSLGNTMDGTIKYIHNCGYWNLGRNTGSSNVTVSLSWDSAACDLLDSAMVKVGNWNGSTWKDLGNGGVTGNKYLGKVANSTTVITWGNFALAYNKCFLTANAGSDQAICEGDSVTTGASPVAGGLGTGSFTYAWSPSTGLSSTSITNPKTSPSSTTDYIISVTDATGCSAQDTVTITYHVLPIADAGTDISLYQGNTSTVIGGSPSISGGTAPYTYNWSPTVGLNYNTISNPTADPSSTISYILLGTDANGCTDLDTVTVTVNNSFDVTWTNLTGVEVSGNTVTKNSGYTRDAGASSMNTLLAGLNGYVDFHVEEITTDKVIGLTSTINTFYFHTFDFCFYMKGDKLYVYNNGNLIGQYGHVAIDDWLRIERKDGYIYFKKNSLSVKQMHDNRRTLVVALSLFSDASSVSNVKCNFNIKTDVEARIENQNKDSLGSIDLTQGGGLPPFQIIKSDNSLDEYEIDGGHINIAHVKSGEYHFSLQDSLQSIFNYIVNVGMELEWYSDTGMVFEEVTIPDFNYASGIVLNGTGVNITKTETDSWENSKIISNNFFQTGQNHKIDFAIPQLNFSAAIGLKIDTITIRNSYDDMKYGLLFNETDFQVINDTDLIDAGGFDAGDRFSIQLRNDQKGGNPFLTFLQNDKVFYTIKLKGQDKYLLESVIFTEDASINNILVVSHPSVPLLSLNIKKPTSNDPNSGEVSVNINSPSIFRINEFSWYDDNNDLLGEGSDINGLSAGSYRLVLNYSTKSGQTLEHTYIVTITEDEKVESICTEDVNRNWVETIVFDEDGNSISDSRVYSDFLGRAIQAQTQLETNNSVMANQTIYDLYGRPVLNTLPAPTGQNELCFKGDFILNTNNTAYSHSDFDVPINTGAAGEVNNPKPVQDLWWGELGWYYSNNNTGEPFVPSTDFPYTRLQYDDNNPGEIKKVSQAGENLRSGSGHEAFSFTMPALGELFYVFGYGYGWYIEQFYNGFGPTLNTSYIPSYKVIKTITQDQNGNESVSFKDLDGKVIATCLSGQVNAANVRTQDVFVTNVGNNLGFIDLHIPEGCGDIKVECVSNYWCPYDDGIHNLYVDIFDLKTGNFYETLTSNSSNVEHTLPAGFYRFKINSWDHVKISYQLNYYNWSLYYYDKANRLKAIIPPNGVADNYVPSVTSSTVVTSKNIESFTNYDDWKNTISTSSPIDGFDLYLTNFDNTFAITIPVSQSNEIQFTDLSVSITDKDVSIPSETANGRIAGQNFPIGADLFSNDDFYGPENRLADEIDPHSPERETYPQCDKYLHHFTFGYALQVFNSNGDPVPYDFGAYTAGGWLNLFDLITTDGNSNVISEEWTLDIPAHHVIDPTASRDIAEIKLYITTVSAWDQVNWLQALGSCEGDVEHGSMTQAIFDRLSEFKFNMIARTKKLDAQPEHTMPTIYEYNSLGNKLYAQTPDAGKTSYVYRKDGSLKFSQNAKQAVNTNQEDRKFSYVNYDEAGRVVESGEYKFQTGINGVTPALFFETHDENVFFPVTIAGHKTVHSSDVIEATGSNEGDLFRTQQNFVMYDIPDKYLKDEQGLSPDYHFQYYVCGKISKTWNDKMVTWYSYDEFGRLSWMVQKILNMDGTGEHRIKTIDYQYDFNGNVTQVAYQRDNESIDNVPGESFYHFYNYDKDKRLTEVFTSRDGISKEKQAAYYYYEHGPLERTEVGKRLQAIDYVYTINGWLKSINSPDLDVGRDPGKDGTAQSHNNFAADLFGMNLDYFSDDYSRDDTYVQTFGELANQSLAPDLYNGLIKSQRWKTASKASWTGLQHNSNELFYGYKYDRQYQLTDANFGEISNVGTMNDGSPSGNYDGPLLTTSDDYKVHGITYDLSGNIRDLNRNGFNIGNGPAMDELSYSYNSLKNQLNKAVDGINTNQFNNFEFQAGQGNDNYVYDEVGELIEDATGQLYYEYDASGLVTGIYKNANHTTPLITIDYDEKGFRLKKTAYVPAGANAGNPSDYTWYIRDASGNLLSNYEEHLIYDVAGQPTSSGLNQTELGVFGASRLGTYSPFTSLTTYELADHLGNVRTTFTKQKLTSVSTGFEGDLPDDYLFSYNDNIDNAVYHGASGSSVVTNFPAQEYGTGILDIEVHPEDVIDATFYSLFNGNDVPNAMIVFDLFDEFGDRVPNQWAASVLNSTPDIWMPNSASYTVNSDLTGNKYFLSIYFWNPDPANIEAWFDDLTIDITPANGGSSTTLTGIDIPQQLSLSDYYPHGSIMPGRSIMGSDNYRFGYQGQFAEKDAETGQNTFELRMYDGLLGRWMTLDPYGQYHSPYLGMGNNPLNNIDPDGGDDGPIYTSYWDDECGCYGNYEYVGDYTGNDLVYFYNEGGLLDGNLSGYEGGNRVFSRNILSDRVPNDFNAVGFFGLQSDGILPDYTFESLWIGGNAAKPLGAATSRLISGLTSKGAPKAIAKLGEWGEAKLAKALGNAGETRKYFRTPINGTGRVVDRLVNGIAHEAKAGVKVKLDTKIRTQILKDVELIQSGQIQGAHWHFFQGADKSVTNFLKANNIPYTIH